MRHVVGFENKPLLDTACAFTFGTFDGVHLGHQHIFKALKDAADMRHLPTACLTFSNHPSDILFPQAAQKVLTSREQKIALLELFGFDLLVELPFDAALRELSALEFLQKIQKMTPLSLVVVGSDVTFGKNCQGNQAFLKAQTDQFQSLFLERYCLDGAPVSSSRIRAAISVADFVLAEKLLGRPYSINLQNNVRYCLPPEGTYAVEVQSDEQKGWKKAIASVSSIGQITLIDYAREPVKFRVPLECRFLEQK